MFCGKGSVSLKIGKGSQTDRQRGTQLSQSAATSSATKESSSPNISLSNLGGES